MTQENELIETSLNEIYRKISIQQYKTDMGFKALAEGVHDNLFVIPEYQRKYRWTKQQVEELATSLLRDLPIPPIYAFRNENGQLEILDGQQRVMSLYFYYIGRFLRIRNKTYLITENRILITQVILKKLLQRNTILFQRSFI